MFACIAEQNGSHVEGGDAGALNSRDTAQTGVVLLNVSERKSNTMGTNACLANGLVHADTGKAP